VRKRLGEPMLKKGLIQIYTGDTDHDNFAPIGLSLRAAGHQFRTHLSCFVKPDWMEGATMAAKLLKPHLTVEALHPDQEPLSNAWGPKETQKIHHLLNAAEKALTGGAFDIVILYGVLRMVKSGVLSLDNMMTLIESKPDHVELILSGPGADETLIHRADLVTEMVISMKQEQSDGETRIRATAPTEVVTGNGKGKTTYCLGKAMLMSCMGIRSTFLQFIKSPRNYGEVMGIQRLPWLEIQTMGEGFLRKHGGASSIKHREAAKRAWKSCLREVVSLKHDLIVFDEINIATYYDLIDGHEVKEMLFLKPKHLHLILSGRNVHLEVREGASTVIEMREIKHPFKKGIKARKGIEY
jgi:cob(I)alamin adenosyltransferase